MMIVSRWVNAISNLDRVYSPRYKNDYWRRYFRSVLQGVIGKNYKWIMVPLVPMIFTSLKARATGEFDLSNKVSACFLCLLSNTTYNKLRFLVFPEVIRNKVVTCFYTNDVCTSLNRSLSWNVPKIIDSMEGILLR